MSILAHLTPKGHHRAILHADQGKQPAFAFGCGRWRDVAADPDLPHAQRLFYPRLGSVESLSVLAFVLSSFAELSSARPLGLERNDARVARSWVPRPCSRQSGNPDGK